MSHIELSNNILECQASHYGENCVHPCHKHCIKETCDKINGSCLYGCEDGELCETGMACKIAMCFQKMI